jgi:hypothetical protein
MNKNEAFDLISKVCAAFTGNLSDHQKIQAALKVIAGCLADKPDEKPVEATAGLAEVVQ